MPSADFCTAVRQPLSPHLEIRHRPPGVRPSAFRTLAEFTVLALDGYGLRDLMLTRPARPASYPVPVRRVATLLHVSFRPRLATTPLRLLTLLLHQDG